LANRALNLRFSRCAAALSDYNPDMRIRPAIVAAFVLMLAACQRQPPAQPLAHEVYVWQRQWTPAVVAAIADAGPTFRAYRVLAAEESRGGALQAMRPELALLERAQMPVTAVIRLDGSIPPPDEKALAERIRAIAAGWRAAGVRLHGIEIDHDCATARLADYARLLRALRADWPAPLRLSITALPAWRDASALPALLALVDESVLQVHAVQSPAGGLFDPTTARRWIDAYAEHTPGPFRIALPAYGLRVGFDDRGSATAVEAEAPRDISASDVRELRVTPDQVGTLLRGLERARPRHLDGVVWFRLPTADDHRAWSLATLNAVIAGDPLRPAVRVTFDAAADGAHDLVLANAGRIETALPQAVVIAAYGCSGGDALEGYRLDHSGDDWRFVRTVDKMLRVGRERRIGWLRCDTIAGMKIDEAH